MTSAHRTKKDRNNKKQDTSNRGVSHEPLKHKSDDRTRKAKYSGVKRKSVGTTVPRALTVITAQQSIGSDMSADEADQPHPSQARQVSQVHTYAEKLSDFEYRCKICEKVSCLI